MRKYLKVLLLTMVALSLMVSSAFALAQLNAGNTTLAAEKISPTVDYAAAAVNTAYQTGGPIAVSTTISVTLVNGNFTAGSTVNMCDSVVAGIVGTGIVAAAPNNGTVNILLSKPLASGIAYNFQSVACAIGVSSPLPNINIKAGSVPGTAVTMNIDSVTAPGDPNVVTSATVLTVVKQFTATVGAVTSKLSFDDNLETFIPTPLILVPPTTPDLDSSQAALTIFSNEGINDKVTVAAGAGACQRILAAGDSFKIIISGDLVGLSQVVYDAVAATPIVAADRTAGKVTATILGNAAKICLSGGLTPDTVVTPQLLELTALNTAGTSINPGTRTAQVTLTGGGNVVAGFTEDLVTAGTASHIIELDATVLYAPLVGSDTANGRETFIKIQTKLNAGVTVKILASDGTYVNYSAGTVVAGTPLTITGSDLKAAVTAAGKTVNGAAGFAAIVYVNSAEANVFAYANIIDPNGAKRVPLKTVGGKIVE